MEIITSAEGEDILADILAAVGEDDDQVETLAHKFEISQDSMRRWLEKVTVTPPDVTIH